MAALKPLGSLKWIHRDDRRPTEDRDIIIITEDGCINEGYYEMFEWDEIICWMYKDDFPFPKEEDFE